MVEIVSKMTKQEADQQRIQEESNKKQQELLSSIQTIQETLQKVLQEKAAIPLLQDPSQEQNESDWDF